MDGKVRILIRLCAKLTIALYCSLQSVQTGTWANWQVLEHLHLVLTSSCRLEKRSEVEVHVFEHLIEEPPVKLSRKPGILQNKVWKLLFLGHVLSKPISVAKKLILWKLTMLWCNLLNRSGKLNQWQLLHISNWNCPFPSKFQLQQNQRWSYAMLAVYFGSLNFLTNEEEPTFIRSRRWFFFFF